MTGNICMSFMQLRRFSGTVEGVFSPKSPKSLKRWHTQPVCGWLKQSLVTRIITAISKGHKTQKLFFFFFFTLKSFSSFYQKGFAADWAFLKGLLVVETKNSWLISLSWLEASLVLSSCRLTQFAADCYFLLIAARLQKIFWELFHGFESSLSLTLSSLWLLLFFIFFAINIVS